MTRGPRPAGFRPRQETVPDWPEDAAPTPGQWLAHLDAQPDDVVRTWMVAGLLKLADDGNWCHQANHDMLTARVEHLSGALMAANRRARRYRLAWIRARRYRALFMRVLAGESVSDAAGPRRHLRP